MSKRSTVCCRCNRAGSCKGCACVKAKQSCNNCLPGKSGNCSNRPAAGSPSSTASKTVNTANAPSSSNLPTLTANATIPQHLTPTATDHSASPIPPSSNTPPFVQQSPLTSHLTPLPEHVSMSTPTFVWGKLTGSDFANTLHTVYAEVVHWRHNCFHLPYGRSGKEFVRELSRLYSAYGSASALESVALKAAVVLPILVLQKPSRTFKTKQHILLERRLGLWSNGDLDELVREGRAIQQRLPKNWATKVNSNLARSFSNLMFMGKCKAALYLLSREDRGGNSPPQ